MPEMNRLTRPKPTQASIDLGEGETVTVVFDAHRITPRWLNEQQERENANDLLAQAKAYADVVMSWDVTDEGQPWPPTVDNIATLSFPVLYELSMAMVKAAAPSSAEGNASSPSANEPQSDSVPVSQNSLNGSDISTSPQPSASLSVT